MTKWQYKVAPIKTRIHSNHFEGGRKPVMEDAQNDLNLWGKEGWVEYSLAKINSVEYHCFKKPKRFSSYVQNS